MRAPESPIKPFLGPSVLPCPSSLKFTSGLGAAGAPIAHSRCIKLTPSTPFLPAAPTPSLAPAINPVLARVQSLYLHFAAVPIASEPTLEVKQEAKVDAAPQPRACAVAAAAHGAVAASLATASAARSDANNGLVMDTIKSARLQYDCDNERFFDPLVWPVDESMSGAKGIQIMSLALPALHELRDRLIRAVDTGALASILTEDDKYRLCNASRLLCWALRSVSKRGTALYLDAELNKTTALLYEALAAPLGYALPHLKNVRLRATLLDELEEQALTPEKLDRGVLQWLGHEIDLRILAFFRREETNGARTAVFLAPPLLLLGPDCSDELAEVYEMQAELMYREIYRCIPYSNEIKNFLDKIANGDFNSLADMRERLERPPLETTDASDADKHGIWLMNLVLRADALLERAPIGVDTSSDEASAWRSLAKTVRRVKALEERNYAYSSLFCIMDPLVVGAPEGYLAAVHRRFKEDLERCIAKAEALWMPAALKAYSDFEKEIEAVYTCAEDLDAAINHLQDLLADGARPNALFLPPDVTVKVDTDWIIDLVMKYGRAWHYRFELHAQDKADAAAAATGVVATDGAEPLDRAFSRWAALDVTGPWVEEITRVFIHFQATTAERERVHVSWHRMCDELSNDKSLDPLYDAMHLRRGMWAPISYEPEVPERLEEPRLRRRRQGG